MPVFCRNPINRYRGTCFDVLCLPLDAYCVDDVGVWRVTFEVEVVSLALRQKTVAGRVADDPQR